MGLDLTLSQIMNYLTYRRQISALSHADYHIFMIISLGHRSGLPNLHDFTYTFEFSPKPLLPFVNSLGHEADLYNIYIQYYINTLRVFPEFGGIADYTVDLPAFYCQHRQDIT